jgi:hypothetical protein
MKILKFGGSSVANPERIENVARIIQSYHDRGEKFAVVVSAMGGMTDLLIEMSQVAASGSTAYEKTLDFFSNKHREVVMTLARSYGRYQAVLDEIIEGQVELGNLLKGLYLTRDLTPRTMDYIQSFGERSSAFMLSEILNHFGVPAVFVNAREVVKTDNNYGAANVFEKITHDNIRRYAAEHADKVMIVTGFISSSQEGGYHYPGPGRIGLFGLHFCLSPQCGRDRNLDRCGRCPDGRSPQGQASLPGQRNDLRRGNGNVSLRSQGDLPAYHHASPAQRHSHSDQELLPARRSWHPDQQPSPKRRLYRQGHCLHQRSFLVDPGWQWHLQRFRHGQPPF